MISYFNQEVKLKLTNKRGIGRWIKEIISKEGYTAGDINYIFTSDDHLSKLNVKYLNHKTLTDIITFNYNEEKRISGDIFISIERVKENAEKYQLPFENELGRVMIHGILHLLGYKDHTDDEVKLMREKETESLALLPVNIV